MKPAQGCCALCSNSHFQNLALPKLAWGLMKHSDAKFFRVFWPNFPDFFCRVPYYFWVRQDCVLHLQAQHCQRRGQVKLDNGKVQLERMRCSQGEEPPSLDRGGWTELWNVFHQIKVLRSLKKCISKITLLFENHRPSIGALYAIMLHQMEIYVHCTAANLDHYFMHMVVWGIFDHSDV